MSARSGSNRIRSEGSVPARDARVYVIIVNWNGWRDTIECLEAVFAQSYENIRVVVCDNGSEDESVERIRAWARASLCAGNRAALSARESLGELTMPAAELVEYDRALAEEGGREGDDDSPFVLIETGENLGFAGGNNVALRYVMARGDAGYAWLLNNDAVADAHALEAMVRLADSNERIGMVGSKLLDRDTPGVIQIAGGGELVPWQGRTRLLGRGELDRGQHDRCRELGYVTGASLLVREQVLRGVGLLDERYFLYSEEVDWCVRTRRAGWRLLYAPGSRLWHREGASVRKVNLISDYYSARNSLLLVEKLYPHLLPLAFVYSLYRQVVPKLLRGQADRLRAVLRAYLDYARRVHGPLQAKLS